MGPDELVKETDRERELSRLPTGHGQPQLCLCPESMSHW